MQYKGTRKPIKQIARELDVDALIEGSALREGNAVRVTVQLINGTTDAHLWANTFDREYKNILALHSDVAHAIAEEIRAALGPEEMAGFTKAPAVNPEAYDHYLRGNAYAEQSAQERSIRAAIQSYEKAVELDPNFGLAYAALSEVDSDLWWYQYDRTSERVAKAKAAVDKALQLGTDPAQVHRALGYYFYHCLLDYDRALEEFAVAQRAKPNDSRILAAIAYVLRRQGKLAEALVNQKRALALDPLSAELAYNTGVTCSVLRNHQEADRYYDSAITLAPDYAAPYAFKARSNLRLAGDTAKARQAITAAQRLGLGEESPVPQIRIMLELYSGNLHGLMAQLSSEKWDALEWQDTFLPKALVEAQICGLLGQQLLATRYFEEASKIAESKVQKQPEEALFHSALGIAYAGLGRKQAAVREARLGVALMPVSKEAVLGYSRCEDLARVYAMVGEYDAALDQLEYLTSIHGDLGVGALRLDPAWAPLRSHPRFQALIRKQNQ
jgi:serine/threonine-protein kinase